MDQNNGNDVGAENIALSYANFMIPEVSIDSFPL